MLESDLTFAPWDGRRVPVTLLGGYLGSGKTTLLNEMLARTDVPIAVLVNDVGEINIDARLVRRHEGGTIELSGGCVCCSLKNGLLAAFDELRQREIPPEHVVLEMSGIADPLATVGLVGGPGFVLDGIVVLVDLDAFLDQVDQETVTGDAVRTQVRAADVVVLTKRDLVANPADREAAVRDRLEQLGVGAPVVAAESVRSVAGFVGLGARRRPTEIDPSPTLFDQHRTAIMALPRPISHANLTKLLADLAPAVVRAKGIAQLEDGSLVTAQVVGSRRSITPLTMADDQPATDLVVISIDP